MKVFQTSLNLKPYKRGFHLITSQIESVLQNFKVTTGTINIFIQHTSASLTINENVDPSVRDDMENFFSDSVDRKSYYNYYRRIGQGSI